MSASSLFLKRKLKRRRSNSYANFAPFVDVLFALLIVFMVASPIMLGGVYIELPKGKAEIIVVKKEPLIIIIKYDGIIILDNNAIKLNTRADKLPE